jgi:hypothetical protein
MLSRDVASIGSNRENAIGAAAVERITDRGVAQTPELSAFASDGSPSFRRINGFADWIMRLLLNGQGTGSVPEL